MSAQHHQPLFPEMTVEEFFAWPGDGTDTRYDLYEGHPRAMAPASAHHAVIQSNTARILANHLIAKGMGCGALTEAAIAPRLSNNRNVRVPDVLVTCRQPKRGELLVPEPLLIVEVMSPSNEAVTQGNIWSHSSIPALNEILVLWSDRVQAEVGTRGADREWPIARTVYLPGALVVLESIGLSCPVEAFYTFTDLLDETGVAGEHAV